MPSNVSSPAASGKGLPDDSRLDQPSQNTDERASKKRKFNEDEEQSNENGNEKLLREADDGKKVNQNDNNGDKSQNDQRGGLNGAADAKSQAELIQEAAAALGKALANATPSAPPATEPTNAELLKRIEELEAKRKFEEEIDAASSSSSSSSSAKGPTMASFNLLKKKMADQNREMNQLRLKETIAALKHNDEARGKVMDDMKTTMGEKETKFTEDLKKCQDDLDKTQEDLKKTRDELEEERNWETAEVEWVIEDFSEVRTKGYIRSRALLVAGHSLKLVIQSNGGDVWFAVGSTFLCSESEHHQHNLEISGSRFKISTFSGDVLGEEEVPAGEQLAPGMVSGFPASEDRVSKIVSDSNKLRFYAKIRVKRIQAQAGGPTKLETWS